MYLGGLTCNFLILIILQLFYLQLKCDDSGSYTDKEIAMIRKLHRKVEMNLTHDLMHEDKYIVRFLRARNHDIDKAEEMIMKSLAWRKKYHIDSILTEDWHWWRRQAPLDFNGTDYEGRPVLSSVLVRIGIRNVIFRGKGAQLVRFLTYAMEQALHTLHQVSNATGKEFVDMWILFEMSGFSRQQHACQLCIQSWFEMLNTYENYYPQLGKGIIAVNAPKLVEFSYRYAKPIMSKHTAARIRVFDFDKAEWKKELLKIIPAESLTVEFGGRARN